MKILPEKFEVDPEKAYLAVAPSPTSDMALFAYILVLTGDGWRFVRENGRAMGCPHKSAEQAIQQVRAFGAMVFEADSLFDFLSEKIKRMV